MGLTWADAGYGIVLLLLDPSGQIVDSQFNGIASGGADAPFDLSARALDATWSAPAAGRWQIVVSDAVFAGQQLAEPFSGRVTLNETPVTPPGIARTVLPGGSFAVTLSVRNDNGPNVAEGYIGYATTDTYSDVPLGQVRGSFGATSITGSSVFTYTTGFVLPGTRLVVSSIAALRPAVPLDLLLADPSGFARAEGQTVAISTGHTTLQATVAAVGGDELPSGAWSGTVTLRRPGDAGARPILVGASYANALTPLAWLSFDHGLQNGRITGGQPLMLLPGQRGALHASATVPLSTAPGTYHAHLFVYTVFGDQVATIPLTITVQAHTGTEPAGRQPRRAVAAWVRCANISAKQGATAAVGIR